MQETVNQETPNETVNEQPKEERLFTQEEVNGFFNKRYSEMMSQLEEFKSKAEKYDALEEANKSELQKATERADALQAQLDSMLKADNVRKIREKVAHETGVPATLLNAEDEETCKAQAKAIMEFAKPGAYPAVPDRGEVHKAIGGGKTRDQFKDWFESSLNH